MIVSEIWLRIQSIEDEIWSFDTLILLYCCSVRITQLTVLFLTLLGGLLEGKACDVSENDEQGKQNISNKPLPQLFA